MTNNEKIRQLTEKLNELRDFKSKLTADTIDDFNKLKKDILELLDNNQKLRFNQITFYTVIRDYSNFSTDDLPF